VVAGGRGDFLVYAGWSRFVADFRSRPTIGCFDYEAMGVEHHLVTWPQQGVTHRPAVDRAAFMRTQVSQHHTFGMRLQSRVAIGEGGVIDADVAFGQTSNQARLVQGDAAAMMRTANPAQNHARIVARFGRAGRGRSRCGRRRLAQQQPFVAINEDRIARTQQGHAAYRPTVHVHAAYALMHLQPQATPIDTELRDRLLGAIDNHRPADEVAADGMHAGFEDQVRLLAVGESQSQGSHVAEIWRGQQSSTPQGVRRGLECRRSHPHNRSIPGDRIMSSIDIRHAHSLPHVQARKAVQEVADKLAERFGIDYDWQGDTLNFTRSGVDGKIDLAPQSLRVTASLGFLMSAFKGPIEAEIKRVLDERFGT
jgi:putative polyhydroxyalkanoate system protein